MNTRMRWSRECRALAAVFPELKDTLGLFEQRFMRDMVKQHEGEDEGRSLDLRRLHIGAWPDMLQDIHIAARQLETGRTTDVADLELRLAALHDKFCEVEGDIGISSRINLTKSAILSEKTEIIASEFPYWVKLLGNRNPETWSDKHTRRVTKEIKKSRMHFGRKIEEMVLAEFFLMSTGDMGGLLELLRDAAYYYDSPWSWKLDGGDSDRIMRKIGQTVMDVHRLSAPAINLLWMYPRVWRNLSTSDHAAKCIIEAIISISDVILFLGREGVVVEDDNTFMIGMDVAKKNLDDAVAALLAENKNTMTSMTDRKILMSNPEGLILNISHGDVDLRRRDNFIKKFISTCRHAVSGSLDHDFPAGWYLIRALDLKAVAQIDHS